MFSSPDQIPRVTEKLRLVIEKLRRKLCPTKEEIFISTLIAGHSMTQDSLPGLIGCCRFAKDSRGALLELKKHADALGLDFAVGVTEAKLGLF